MATNEEYQALIDSLSGECERLHKENEELKKAIENHDTFMKYAYSQGKQDALSQEPCKGQKMTRVEAINVLKVLASFQGVMEYLEQHSVSVQDACNMAIQALEQTDIEQKAQEYEKAFMDGFESCSDLFTRNKEQQPCKDAISRDAAIRAIKNLYPDIPRVDFNGAKRKWADKYAQYIECERLIEQLPSVTQKSETVTEFADRCRECGKMRKGHWIYDETIENWRCSKCNETPKTMGYVGTDDFMAEHFKFCNHCGAKMESEE